MQTVSAIVFDAAQDAARYGSLAMALACKCGCGEPVKKGRVFVNKEHQLAWMVSGGASEMNALMPDDARVRGGETAGKLAAESGRLYEMAIKGAARSRQIAKQFHRSREGQTE